MNEDIIPEGLRFLKGPQQSEEETNRVLDECCESHWQRINGKMTFVCKHQEDCNYIHAVRCNNDSKSGGWHWGYKNTPRPHGIPWRPDREKYADSLPQLSFSAVKCKIRENRLGGLQ